MAYSKQTWDTTSYVNPTRMNHIEDGIYSADTKTANDIPYASGVSVKTQIDKKGGKITEVNLQQGSFNYDSSSKMWVSKNPFSYYYGSRKIYSIDVKPGYAATVANAFIMASGYIGVVGIATTNMAVMGEGSTFTVHFVLEEYN